MQSKNKTANPIPVKESTPLKQIADSIKNFSFKNWLHEQTSYFRDALTKFKNLRKANIELGITHFNAGRTKDAILRFKIVKYFFPDVKIANYYIGRSYIENWDFSKSKSYLEKYLESGDTELREEAKYCYDLALERYDNIKKIPISLVTRIFNNIAPKYDDIYIWTGCPQEKVLSQIRAFRGTESPKIFHNVLDVGCGNGSIVYELKCDMPETNFYGIDASNKLAEKAKALRLPDGSKIFEDILLADLENETLIKELSNKKFDLIIFSLVLDYTSNLESILKAYTNLLSDTGVIALTFHTGSKKTIHALFDREYEEFYHSENTIKSIAEKFGLHEIASDDSDFLGHKIGKVKLFSKQKTQITEAKDENQSV